MSFTNTLRVAAFISLFLVFPQKTWAQQQLSYKLEQGEIFRIKQKAEQLIIQELEGTKHEMTNDLDALFTFTVLGENDKGFDIKLTFEDFGLKSTSSIQGELFNVRASQPIEGDMMSQMFSGMVGYELQLVLRSDGKILEVIGGDELVEKMVASANIEDEFTQNLMKKSLGKEFSSDGLGKSFEQMTYFYPENQVEVGDTWKNQFDGKMTAENLWKFEKKDAKLVFISGTSSIVMKTDENGTVMSLKGTQESTIETTLQNGFINKINTNSFAEGISILANMKDVEIPTSIKSEITYEVIQ